MPTLCGSSTARGTGPFLARARMVRCRPWATLTTTSRPAGTAAATQPGRRPARPEHGHPAGVGVAEGLVRQLRHDLADRGQPGPARERGQVGRADPRVVGRARQRRRGAGRRREGLARRRPRRALPGRQGSPRRPAAGRPRPRPRGWSQVAGELAAGRQPDARGQPGPSGRRASSPATWPARLPAAVDLELQLRQMDLYISPMIGL